MPGATFTSHRVTTRRQQPDGNSPRKVMEALDKNYCKVRFNKYEEQNFSKSRKVDSKAKIMMMLPKSMPFIVISVISVIPRDAQRVY
jgi:hypothetical protein